YQTRNYQLREEFQSGPQTLVEIVNNYASWRVRNGAVSALPRANLKFHRDQMDRHFMELIVNYARPQLSIAYLGVVDLGGLTAHRVRLELIPELQGGILTPPEPVLSEVFIDTRTARVVKEARLLQKGYGAPSVYEETLFLEYTAVNGAL